MISNTVKMIALALVGLLVGFGIGYETRLLMTPTSTESETIKIGIIQPLTGSQAELGKSGYLGMKTGLEWINRKGGIKSMGGVKLQFVTGDCQSDVSVAKSEAERLITVEGVKIIIGTFGSDLAYAASEVAARYNVTYIECSGSAPNILERGYRYLFRVSTDHMTYGERIINAIADLIGPKIGKTVPSETKVGFLYENNLFAATFANATLDYAESQGYNIVYDQAYAVTTQDLTPQMTLLKQAAPDVVIWPMVATAKLGLTAMKELNVYVPAIVSCGMTSLPAFATSVGANALYMMQFIFWNNDYDLPGMDEFAALFDELFPGDRSYFGAWSGTGYVGMRVLDLMLEDAASLDPEKLREAAYSIDIAIPDIIGYGVKFDAVGQNIRSTASLTQWLRVNNTLTQFTMRTDWGWKNPDHPIVLPRPQWSDIT